MFARIFDLDTLVQLAPGDGEMACYQHVHLWALITLCSGDILLLQAASAGQRPNRQGRRDGQVQQRFR
jgi:hypothetical protein